MRRCRNRLLVGLGLLLGLAYPAAAQTCSAPAPPLDPALAAIATASGFFDLAYLAALEVGPPPCILFGQTTAGLNPVWTLTFTQASPPPTTQVQLFVVSAGYWQLDIPTGAAPALTLSAPTPAPNPDGSLTLTIAPALVPTQIYRAQIVGVSGQTVPFAAEIVTLPSTLLPFTSVLVVR